VTPEELIAEGIKVIERDGWHQGDLYEGRMSSFEPDYSAARQSVLGKTAPVCGSTTFW
jgi:hypothetical protein